MSRKVNGCVAVDAKKVKDSLALKKDQFLTGMGQPYPSMVMGKNINDHALCLFDDTLAGLMELDSRGGYFFHDDIVKGFQLLQADDKEWSEKLTAMAATKQSTPAAAIEKLAYITRVMLNHVRKRHTDLKKGKKADHDGGLACILKKMVEHGVASSKASSDCPLPCFREQSSQQQDLELGSDSDADTPGVVATYWDGDLLMAVQLKTDSSLVPATWYEHGASGLVVAFFENGLSLMLEIPNACLVDGKFDKEKLAPPAIPISKLQAKKKEKAEKEAAKASGGATPMEVDSNVKKESSSKKKGKGAKGKGRGKGKKGMATTAKKLIKTQAKGKAKPKPEIAPKPKIPPTSDDESAPVAEAEEVAPPPEPAVVNPPEPIAAEIEVPPAQDLEEPDGEPPVEAPAPPVEAPAPPVAAADEPLVAEHASIKINLTVSHNPDKYAIQLGTRGCHRDKAQLIEFAGGGTLAEKERRFQVFQFKVARLLPLVEKVSDIPRETLIDIRTTCKSIREARGWMFE
jgi:hypothetical protein